MIYISWQKLDFYTCGKSWRFHGEMTILNAPPLAPTLCVVCTSWAPLFSLVVAEKSVNEVAHQLQQQFPWPSRVKVGGPGWPLL